MNFQRNKFIILAVCCLSVFSCTSGEVCKPPKRFAQDLDYDWVMGQHKWYFPMMNKAELERVSSDLLKETLKTISTMPDLTSTACLTGQWEGMEAVIKGFTRKQTTYSLSPTDWTNFNILGFEKSWGNGLKGTLYITKTDNKHFLFITRCWEDDTRSWFAMTTSKNPSDKLKAKILAHAKHLGFPVDDQNVEYIQYDKCTSADGKTEL